MTTTSDTWISNRTFWVGGERIDTSDGPRLRGQLCVTQLQGRQREPRSTLPPYVLVHGGGSQSLDFLVTPDGRLGWAPQLAARGHDVYVVDRAAHGRSPYDPELLGPAAPQPPFALLASMFFPSADGAGSHPTSGLHTQWPGGRTFDDPVVRTFFARQSSTLADVALAQSLDRDGVVDLLDRIGPAVVIAHSAGAPTGFLVADARPESVLALIACEPLGPPFVGVPGTPLSYGLSEAPLTYEPQVTSASELATVQLDSDSPTPFPFLVQAEPPRRLVSLARTPVVVVTAEASPFRWIDDHTCTVLQQAGVTVDHLRLWEAGIHGNAHGFPWEANSDEVLDAVLRTVGGLLEH